MTDERYTIRQTSYWPGVDCIFLQGDSGTLHFARRYQEWEFVHDTLDAGHNRCLIADSSGLELWDLAQRAAYVWEQPGADTLPERFLWGGLWAMSPGRRFAAIAGGPNMVARWLYLVDLQDLTLTEIRFAPGTSHDLIVRAVDDRGVALLSEGQQAGAVQWRADPTGARTVDGVPPAHDASSLLKPAWDAPTSREASQMPRGMPVTLTPQPFARVEQLQL